MVSHGMDVVAVLVGCLVQHGKLILGLAWGIIYLLHIDVDVSHSLSPWRREVCVKVSVTASIALFFNLQIYPGTGHAAEDRR